jgi:predicted XRE-type DNA-binding protein
MRGIDTASAAEGFIFQANRLLTALKKRGLKQVETAELFGVRQPDVSKMLRGDFRQFSVERLLRFLVALDQDVIVVKPHRDRSEAPAMQVL